MPIPPCDDINIRSLWGSRLVSLSNHCRRRVFVLKRSQTNRTSNKKSPQANHKNSPVGTQNHHFQLKKSQKTPSPHPKICTIQIKTVLLRSMTASSFAPQHKASFLRSVCRRLSVAKGVTSPQATHPSFKQNHQSWNSSQ